MVALRSGQAILHDDYAVYQQFGQEGVLPGMCLVGLLVVINLLEPRRG